MDGLGSAEIFEFGGFRFDRAGGCLSRLDGLGVAEPVTLGSRALALLAVLIERQGQLVSKDEIFAAVWPGTAVEEANLTMQISALRRVLDRNRAQGSCIQTVSGRGYRFVSPVTRTEALTAASMSTSGNGSGGPVGAAAQPEPPSAMRPIDALPPGPRPSAPQRLRRAVIATVAGALCLAAVVAAAVNWHLFLPREDRSAPRLSIVVLPFTNLSNDSEQQYFADAVTEDLTVDMSRIAHMFVISRNTAFTYRNKPVDAKQIGRDLGVRYVLEGSVRRSRNEVRVSSQLIDAETDAHLWAERFDRVTTDLFSLEDEITRRIANTLSQQLTRAEAGRPTADPDALDYILRGRAAIYKGAARENYAEAISLFERALALDPSAVEAKAGLAFALVNRVNTDMSDSRAADLARAEGLVDQALAASPRSASAHYIKGQVLRARKRCAEAIPEFETAIALDRNNVGGLFNLGRCRVLTGSPDDAIPLMEQAIRLAPANPYIGFYYFSIGQVHLLQSRTDEAIVWLEKANSANPGFGPNHAWLASAYGLKGDTERAAAELAEARKLSSVNSYSSIAHLRTVGYWGVPKVRALFEATYFAGLRKAGVPEE